MRLDVDVVGDLLVDRVVVVEQVLVLVGVIVVSLVTMHDAKRIRACFNRGLNSKKGLFFSSFRKLN